MEAQITDERLIALIEGKEDQELLKRINEDAVLRQRYEELKELINLMEQSVANEVPEHIRLNLDQAIADELNSQTNNYSWLQVAAAVALLILGFGLGRFSGASNQEEFAALRSEIQSLREASLTGTLQVSSASQRIQAVNQIEATSEVNPQLIAALINTLNSDDSPNVRFAALQALNNYIDQEEVRAELVKSLESQSDPLIQISLISILVEAEERSAIVPLKDLLDDAEVTPEVRQQAKVAIKILT